jgi:hypothetical protein
MGHRQLLLCPPLSVGPPPGELSLQPLVESLKPENLVGLFAALLLEHRVLLRVSSVGADSRGVTIMGPSSPSVFLFRCSVMGI